MKPKDANPRKTFSYCLQTPFGRVSVARILADDVLQAAIKAGEMGIRDGPQSLLEETAFPDENTAFKEVLGVIRTENGLLHLEIVKGLESPNLFAREMSRISDKGNFLAMVNADYFYFLNPPPESLEPGLRSLLTPLLGKRPPGPSPLILPPKPDKKASRRMLEFAEGFSVAMEKPVRITLHPCTSGGGMCLMNFALGKPRMEVSRHTTMSETVSRIISTAIKDREKDDMPVFRLKSNKKSGYLLDLAEKDGTTNWTEPNGRLFAQMLRMLHGFAP